MNSEPGHQRIDVALRHVARVTDLVCHVARGVGDHGQVIAQARHVGERSVADGADLLDLRAVLADQRLQPVGVGGKPLVREASQSLEIA